MNTDKTLNEIQTALPTLIDDCKSILDDEIQSVDLTIGFNWDGKWAYQTGDNSFYGNAYGYRFWIVLTIDAETTTEDLREEVEEQFELAQADEFLESCFETAEDGGFSG